MLTDKFPGVVCAFELWMSLSSWRTRNATTLLTANNFVPQTRTIQPILCAFLLCTRQLFRKCLFTHSFAVTSPLSHSQLLAHSRSSRCITHYSTSNAPAFLMPSIVFRLFVVQFSNVYSEHSKWAHDNNLYTVETPFCLCIMSQNVLNEQKKCHTQR